MIVFSFVQKFPWKVINIIGLWCILLLCFTSSFESMLGDDPMVTYVPAVVPKESITLHFVCVDPNTGDTIPEHYMNFQVWNPENNSGGHYHNINRPKMTITSVLPPGGHYTNGNGVDVTYKAGHGIGQIENIVAYCGGTPGYFQVHVIEPYLSYLGVPPNSILIGAEGTQHTSLIKNHYGRQVLRDGIRDIINQYHGEFWCVVDPPEYPYIHGYEPVGINDMALIYGGIFDIDNNWQVPHKWHSKGRSVDFRCKNNMPNSVIYVQPIIDRFLYICGQHDLPYAIFENKVPGNEHIHCGVTDDN